MPAHTSNPRLTSTLPANVGETTVPSWLLNALDDGLRPFPPPRQHPSNAAHIRTPDPKHKRLPSRSPSPTPPPKVPRNGVVGSASRPLGLRTTSVTSSSHHRPSAYAFADDDPDARWSTLARTSHARRGGATQGRPGVRHSGCFRLPILGVGAARRAVVAESAETKQRVITYLPPPRTAWNQTLGRGPVEDLNICPIADTNTNTSWVGTEVDSPDQEEEQVEIRVMDSDVTLVNEDEDGGDVVAIDLDAVCARYSKTRAGMKTVRVVFVFSLSFEG